MFLYMAPGRISLSNTFFEEYAMYSINRFHQFLLELLKYCKDIAMIIIQLSSDFHLFTKLFCILLKKELNLIDICLS